MGRNKQFDAASGPLLTSRWWRMAIVTILALGVVFQGSGDALAGALYINEFATPSMGVAGAGQEAVANDASTNFAFHNPAGMTRLEGHSVSLGAGLLVGDTRFDTDSDTPFSGGDGGDQAGFAPLLGSHGVLSVTDDLKLGMSVFSISGAALDPNSGWSGRSARCLSGPTRTITNWETSSL